MSIKVKILIAIIFITVWACIMFSLTARADEISFMRERDFQLYQQRVEYVSPFVCIEHGGKPDPYPVIDLPPNIGDFIGFIAVNDELLEHYQHGVVVYYTGIFEDYDFYFGREGFWYHVATVSCIFRR